MLTLEKVQEKFLYNQDTGVITRKIDSGSRGRKGDVAGSVTGQGYREINIDGKSYGAHRVAWMLHYGEEAPPMIDHINQDKLDNRICNLRAATRAGNSANRPRLKNNQSGAKGCYFLPSHGVWRVQCRVDGKLFNLGRHKTLEGARQAYNDFASKAFGEFYSPS